MTTGGHPREASLAIDSLATAHLMTYATCTVTGSKACTLQDYGCVPHDLSSTHFNSFIAYNLQAIRLQG